MTPTERRLLSNALDSLDRLFDGDSSVVDVQELLFATAHAFRESVHASHLQLPAADLLTVIRSGEPEDAQRDRALYFTHHLRRYLAGLKLD